MRGGAVGGTPQRLPDDELAGCVTQTGPVVRFMAPERRAPASQAPSTGGAVTFNLCDTRGEPIPYTAVEARARNSGVACEGGCF